MTIRWCYEIISILNLTRRISPKNASFCQYLLSKWELFLKSQTKEENSLKIYLTRSVQCHMGDNYLSR